MNLFAGATLKATFSLWKKAAALAACVIAVLICPGCMSDPAISSGTVMSERPARPARILVRDFAVAPADIQEDAPIGARISAGTSLPAEQVALDRSLASNVTSRLVTTIRTMGLPAEQSMAETPQVGDVVIRGYFVSVFETAGANRLNIGFDPSASEMLMVVETFQVMSQGYGRPLGQSGATPQEKALAARIGATTNPAGNIVTTGLKKAEASTRSNVENWAEQSVKEMADRLGAKFHEQGWMN